MSRQISPVWISLRGVRATGFYCAGRSIVVGPGDAAAGLALLADLDLDPSSHPKSQHLLAVELRDGRLRAAESDHALVDPEAVVKQYKVCAARGRWLRRLE